MADSISVDEIDDGYILAEPVINSFGQTILGVGIVLKKKHKMLLKTWDIEKVLIKTTDDDEVQEVSSDLKQLAREQFFRRCLWNPENKFEDEIVNIGISRIVDKMSQFDKKGLGD